MVSHKKRKPRGVCCSAAGFPGRTARHGAPRRPQRFLWKGPLSASPGYPPFKAAVRDPANRRKFRALEQSLAQVLEPPPNIGGEYTTGRERKSSTIFSAALFPSTRQRLAVAARFPPGPAGALPAVAFGRWACYLEGHHRVRPISRNLPWPSPLRSRPSPSCSTA